MDAIGYARVSTADQAQHGVSLEAQTEKIQAMGTVQGANLTDILIDAGESAKSLNRTGMTELLRKVDSGKVQAVIIYKLDRLTRSVRDLGALLERFEKKRVALISVTESLDTSTAAGRMVINIMMSVSQWEREAIGERTKDALAHLKANGLRVGNIPYGFELAPDGKTLIENGDEQAVIRKIRDLRDEGLSLRAIAQKLNREGYKTRKRTSWKFQYVSNILKSAT